MPINLQNILGRQSLEPNTWFWVIIEHQQHFKFIFCLSQMSFYYYVISLHSKRVTLCQNVTIYSRVVVGNQTTN